MMVEQAEDRSEKALRILTAKHDAWTEEQKNSAFKSFLDDAELLKNGPSAKDSPPEKKNPLSPSVKAEEPLKVVNSDDNGMNSEIEESESKKVKKSVGFRNRK